MKHKAQIFLMWAYVLLASIAIHAQSKPAVEKGDVIKEAQRQLEEMSSVGGVLFEYCTKNSIKGEFVMDFTIQGKGKLLTVYMVTSSVEDVKYQNMLKNKLTEIQFSDIKLPKNERVKFRHTLTF
jgi:hypothetical protein